MAIASAIFTKQTPLELKSTPSSIDRVEDDDANGEQKQAATTRHSGAEQNHQKTCMRAVFASNTEEVAAEKVTCDVITRHKEA